MAEIARANDVSESSVLRHRDRHVFDGIDPDYWRRSMSAIAEALHGRTNLHYLDGLMQKALGKIVKEQLERFPDRDQIARRIIATMEGDPK